MRPTAVAGLVLVLCARLSAASDSARTGAGVRKIEDIILYEDARFYSAFPSIVKRRDGGLLLAFRRAPDRRAFGERGITHTDPNSCLVLVRSSDGGRNWGREPQLIYAHPFGGSQDPCMLQLRDDTLLCTSYAWAPFEPDAISRLRQPVARAGNYVFLGGYLMRSRDGGRSWAGPMLPPPCQGEFNLDPFGHTIFPTPIIATN